MARSFISKRVQNMDVSGVRKMFEMASKISNPIDLTLGLPDYDVPDIIKEEAIKHIKKGKNRYTPTSGILELRENIQEKLKKKNGIDVDIEQILVSSSVSGALSAVLITILDEGDEVILFDPYFVGYKQLVIQNGGIPIYVKTNDDYSVNFESLEKSITGKTKGILINSPNNPTGYVMGREELVKLGEIAKDKDLLIVSDEIYEDFVYRGEHFSLQSKFDNVITLNGFSKNCAMTGWRVGYVCGPKDIISSMIKVQQFNFVCAPTPFQYAAIKALDVDMRKKVEEYKEKSEMVYDGLKERYELEIPKGAFYVFVKYPYEGEKFISDCISNSLLVVPGNVFSEENTHFRISFATSKDTLRKAIEVLNKITD